MRANDQSTPEAYVIVKKASHYELYTVAGMFVLAADTYSEVLAEVDAICAKV